MRHIKVHITSTNNISTTAMSAANILKALKAHIPHGLNILNLEKLYMYVEEITQKITYIGVGDTSRLNTSPKNVAIIYPI